MTDTAVVAEIEADVDEVRKFKSIEDMIVFHNPLWSYLVNRGLEVRPPTEDEAAVYAARATDPAWQDLYIPADPPRIILPPTPEIAALLEGQPEPAPPAADDEQAGETAQHAALDAFARWTKGVTLADPETAQADPDAEVVEGVVVDDAATRFMEAFKEDPEGEQDRAQPPAAPEVHHETPEVSG